MLQSHSRFSEGGRACRAEALAKAAALIPAALSRRAQDRRPCLSLVFFDITFIACSASPIKSPVGGGMCVAPVPLCGTGAKGQYKSFHIPRLRCERMALRQERAYLLCPFAPLRLCVRAQTGSLRKATEAPGEGRGTGHF
jgi:hypothetical protein